MHQTRIVRAMCQSPCCRLPPPAPPQNLYVSVAALQPPAGEQAILDAERATGVRWPSELKHWYRLHNGVDGHDFNAAFFPLSSPLSLDAVVRAHATWTQAWADHLDMAGGATLEEMMAAPAGKTWWIWLPAYIPFASDCGTEDLVLDTREGPLCGLVRGFDKVSADQGDPYWMSLGEALEDVLLCLTESRETKTGWTPKVVEGHLDWEC